MSSFVRSRRFPIIALWALVVAFFIREYVINRNLTPPSKHCSLAEFAAAAPPPARLAVVDALGGRKLIWVGPLPRLSIRSGPPCYVFEEGGRLVDWRPESGEGWEYDGLVIQSYKKHGTTLEEALRWAGGANGRR